MATKKTTGSAKRASVKVNSLALGTAGVMSKTALKEMIERAVADLPPVNFEKVRAIHVLMIS